MMPEYKGVMVYCDINAGKLAAISTEILGAGSKLAAELGQELIAVIVGSGVSALAQEAIAYGAQKVYAVDDAMLKDYLSELYLSVVENVMKMALPSILLIGQTQNGRDLAPRLAFKFNTSATMDCVALDVDPSTKRLMMTKPVYGGNALAVQYCETDPQIATVRTKVMSALSRDDSRKGEIINVPASIDSASMRTKIIDRKIEAAGGIKLEDARVIVSGGRGIGSAEGFKQLDEVARILKGAVGASRPPCDNKWVSDNLQVGLTGKIISPEVYIAVAISGSSQHLSGCSGSRVIVAINKDAEANIFKVAHYGIVADWKKALPAFTAKIKELVS
jgi:electron transfer flavoprotein alpha subunit